ncbi:MAG: hypothetical protein KGI54_14020 [Pseudomonadota bacterium]|nr:hypothetical protein [Pseudomonadota bacterium]
MDKGEEMNMSSENIFILILAFIGLIAIGYTIWIWHVATESLKRTELLDPWNTNWNSPVEIEKENKDVA